MAFGRREAVDAPVRPSRRTSEARRPVGGPADRFRVTTRRSDRPRDARRLRTAHRIVRPDDGREFVQSEQHAMLSGRRGSCIELFATESAPKHSPEARVQDLSLRTVATAAILAVLGLALTLRSMQTVLTTAILSALSTLGVISTAVTTPASGLSPSMLSHIARPKKAASVRPRLSCERDGRSLGLCGTPDSLYPTCTEAFSAACKESGGKPISCGQDGFECATTINCLDGSPLYAACDEEFIVACPRDAGGSFTCTQECDDGSCCLGTCEID